MKRNKSFFSVSTGLNSSLAPSNSILFNILYYLLCVFIFPIFSIISFVLFTFKYFKRCIFNLHNYT